MSETIGDTKGADNSALSQISAAKLDRTGTHIVCSRFCLPFIKSRNLIGCITGEKKAPVVTDSRNSQWDSDNSFVMASLPNTMHPRIFEQYLLLDIVEKIWNSTRRTYSRKGNDAQIFEI